jgi:acyl carrier protein phosphodiesterase
MNFLAHAHLSGNNDEILFGNFIADAVKGNPAIKYEGHILKGIIIHRKIDVFTDNHEIHKNSRNLIRENFGKFSGIVVDIFYDHFLAANWSKYSTVLLKDFTSHVYFQLTKRFFMLPYKTKRLLPFMISQNWLLNYSNFEGLDNVFYGMDKRTGFKSNMKNATITLKKHYDKLKVDFEMFYPELIGFVNNNIDISDSIKKSTN